MSEPIVFCTGGGCTAKLGAGVLSRILEKLPRGVQDPNLLVGYDSKDDAAVYKITEDTALVQTVDFFRRWSMTPIPLARSLLQTPSAIFMRWEVMSRLL